MDSVYKILGLTPSDPPPQDTNNLDLGPRINIPLPALNVLAIIDNTGAAPPNTAGGATFDNDGRGGGQVLPPTDDHGNNIEYREWDVNPRSAGPRDAERIVTGSDGSAYYTNDHYKTFEKMR